VVKKFIPQRREGAKQRGNKEGKNVVAGVVCCVKIDHKRFLRGILRMAKGQKYARVHLIRPVGRIIIVDLI